MEVGSNLSRLQSQLKTGFDSLQKKAIGSANSLKDYPYHNFKLWTGSLNLKRTAKPNLENERHKENSLRLWIQEAKNVAPKKRYFCEILLDRVLYARTTSKRMTEMLFWGEEFDLNNLPCLNSVTVQLWREADPKKRKDRNQFIGFVTISIKELTGSETDRWHPILPPSHQHVYQQSLTTLSSASAHNLASTPSGEANPIGSSQRLNNTNSSRQGQSSNQNASFPSSSQSAHHISQLANGSATGGTDGPFIRIKGRYQSIEVLPVSGYVELSEFLSRHSVDLMTRLEGSIQVKEKEELSVAMVTLHQKQGLATQFLTDLVMHEINRLDNDNMAFRGNSLATKSMESYLKLVGEKYLHDTLGDFIQTVMCGSEDCEVDPLRLSSPSLLERNMENLNMYVDMVWAKIYTSSVYFPRELKNVFAAIRGQISLQQNRSPKLSDHVTSACIFLRYICPAILSPSLFGLTQKFPEDQRIVRNFTLVAKSIQSLANFSPFGVKEGYMDFMNRFVQNQTEAMHRFLDRISSITPVQPQGLHNTQSSHPGQPQNFRPSASLGYLNQMGSVDFDDESSEGPSCQCEEYIDLQYELAKLNLHLKDAIKKLPEDKQGSQIVRLKTILRMIDQRLKGGYNPPPPTSTTQQHLSNAPPIQANNNRRQDRIPRQQHNVHSNQSRPAEKGQASSQLPNPSRGVVPSLSTPMISAVSSGVAMDINHSNQRRYPAPTIPPPAQPIYANQSYSNPNKPPANMMTLLGGGIPQNPVSRSAAPHSNRPTAGYGVAPIATHEEGSLSPPVNMSVQQQRVPIVNAIPAAIPRQQMDTEWNQMLTGAPSHLALSPSDLYRSHPPGGPPLPPSGLNHEEHTGTVSSSGYHSQASPPLTLYHGPNQQLIQYPVTTQPPIQYQQKYRHPDHLSNVVYDQCPSSKQQPISIHGSTAQQQPSPVYSEVLPSPPSLHDAPSHRSSLRPSSVSSSSTRSGSPSSSSYSTSSVTSSRSSSTSSCCSSSRHHSTRPSPPELDATTLTNQKPPSYDDVIQRRPLPNVPVDEIADRSEPGPTEIGFQIDSSTTQYEREIQYLRNQLKVVESRLTDTQTRLVTNEKEKVRLLEEWQTRAGQLGDLTHQQSEGGTEIRGPGFQTGDSNNYVVAHNINNQYNQIDQSYPPSNHTEGLSALDSNQNHHRHHHSHHHRHNHSQPSSTDIGQTSLDNVPANERRARHSRQHSSKSLDTPNESLANQNTSSHRHSRRHKHRRHGHEASSVHQGHNSPAVGSTEANYSPSQPHYDSSPHTDPAPTKRLQTNQGLQDITETV